MKDDFTSLFAFNRWANAKMLDACRKLTAEQYAAEPVPGWGSVGSTVYHMSIVTAPAVVLDVLRDAIATVRASNRE